MNPEKQPPLEKPTELPDAMLDNVAGGVRPERTRNGKITAVDAGSGLQPFIVGTGILTNTHGPNF
jgi:hypothetical protein